MEYLLHLTKLYPDMMYIHQDSGLINVAYFKFNIDDAKGKKFWLCWIVNLKDDTVLSCMRQSQNGSF